MTARFPAKNAKALTQKKIEETAKDTYLECVYQKIMDATNEGKFYIIDPFCNLRCKGSPTLTVEIVKELLKILTADGYVITEENCGGDYYTKLSWEK